MNVDSAFMQRHKCENSHAICQDYALSGTIHNLYYAIVADGRSVIREGTSTVAHPYSDFSSRVVGFCAKECLRELQEHGCVSRLLQSDFITLLRSKVKNIGDQVGLTNIGDSTLNVICYYNDIIMNLMIGDGVIVIEHDDEYIIRVRKFEPNMPFCISHLLNTFARTKYEEYNVVLTEQEFIIDKATFGIRYNSPIKIPYDKIADLYSAYNTKSISVLSDGIEYLRKEKQLSLVEAILQLFPFKSTEGQFVKRRMHEFERHLNKENIIANDDIAMATIVL